MGGMSQVLGKEGGKATEHKLLQIEELSVRFSKSHRILGNATSAVLDAVRNVSFDMDEGEILSLVGESGSGKTTVAKCILRLVSPTAGSIRFEGVDIKDLKGKQLRHYLRNSQIVFQDPFESLNPRLTVEETISLPIRYLVRERNSKVVYEKVVKILGEVGLNWEEVIGRFPHQLSGGQRQRVNIARALASDPKLLIADEPITMLDAAQRLNILRLLANLRSSRKLTVLMITHDLASAKMISDRILVMYLGRVVEMGPAQDLLSRPHHPYVELIKSSMPTLAEPLADHEETNKEELAATIEESRKIMQGCVFRPRCAYATTVCSELEPELVEKSKSHYAACHNALH